MARMDNRLNFLVAALLCTYFLESFKIFESLILPLSFPFNQRNSFGSEAEKKPDYNQHYNQGIKNQIFCQSSPIQTLLSVLEFHQISHWPASNSQ